MPDDDEETKPDPKEKLYTEKELQDRLNRVGSQEKKDGKRVREAEILEELGVVDLKELKDLVTRSKEEEDRAKTEIQKAQEAADRAKAEAAQERKAASQERFDAMVERALLAGGLAFPEDAEETEKVKILNRARRSLDLTMDDGEPDQSTIAKAVEDLKTDVPSFFKAEKKQPDPKPVHGDPGGPPAKIPQSDAAAQAQEQLHRLHPELARKTPTGS